MKWILAFLLFSTSQLFAQTAQFADLNASMKPEVQFYNGDIGADNAYMRLNRYPDGKITGYMYLLRSPEQKTNLVGFKMANNEMRLYSLGSDGKVATGRDALVFNAKAVINNKISCWTGFTKIDGKQVGMEFCQ
jgi:hypothetical protein